MIALLIANCLLLSASAQDSGPTSSLKIVRLTPPAYPPLAVAAFVSGEVEIQVSILENGATGDVRVKTGPPWLRQAAVESAERSQFQPVGTENVSNSYRLIYKFVLDPTGCREARDSSYYPHVSYDSNVITLSEKPIPICDAAPDIRVRSAKCLFLWRCGLKTQ